MYQGAFAPQETHRDIPENIRKHLAERAAEITVTPEELRDATFKKTLRGYDPVAVGNMLHRAAVAIEELALQHQEVERLTRDGADNARLRADIRGAEQKLTAFEIENADLRNEIEELRRQIPMLQHQSTMGKSAGWDEANGVAAQQIAALESHASTLKAENAELVNKVAVMQASLDDCIRIAAEAANATLSDHWQSDALVESLQKAIEMVENTVTNAKEILTKEAAGILQAAKAQAADITAAAASNAAAVLADARGQAEQIRSEVLILKEKTEQRVQEYRSLLESHLHSFSLSTTHHL